MRYTPLSELESRVSRLQKLMKEKNIDGAIIVQNADLFYFSGTVQRSHIFIPVEGKPVLMVKKSYDRAKQESALENIIPLKSMKELPEKVSFFYKGKLKRIGFELDVIPANLYFYYEKLFDTSEIVDISPLIREVRAVKSPYELEIIKDAAKLNQTLFSHVREFLHEGITEVELAGKLESVYRKEGHQCYIRMRGFNQETVYGNLTSGYNMSVPSFFDGPIGGRGLNPSFPQSAGFKKICRDEPVIVDYVGVYDGYMVDQTRIFCIGKLPEKLIRAYNVALEIQELIKEKAKPGISCAVLYELAIKAAQNNGLEEHFMGYSERVNFIGHGVGIELDELPVIARGVNKPLKEGMVLALEPKFVFPEGAVGIENTFVVRENGLELLTIYDESIGYIT